MGNEMVIVRNPANLELWQERISECRRSGMTVAAWCDEQGLSEKTYYYSSAFFWHNDIVALRVEGVQPVIGFLFDNAANAGHMEAADVAIPYFGAVFDEYLVTIKSPKRNLGLGEK